MNILIITQYFPPEVGAPQNRLYELAIKLKEKGSGITILTAMPNYPQMKIYQGYRWKLYKKEVLDGLQVHRAWIFSNRSKAVFARLLNYFSFVFSSLATGIFISRRFDYIICESPPLFLGITSYILSKLKRAKLIFNVSDLWPESAEKLKIVSNPVFLKMATRLEEFMYRKSHLITAQTNGIVANISKRFPKKRVEWLPNGVNLDYYNPDQKYPDWRLSAGFNNDDFIILYAGILGYAQGLEVIINAAEKLKDKRKIKFVLLGSGPEKSNLIRMKEVKQLSNVVFKSVVSKAEMPSVLQSVDVALIPLRRLDLFKGALPSKIFENLGMKKPILLGVEGEAKEHFIDKANAGLAFIPEDSVDLSKKVIQLYGDRDKLNKYGENGYAYVREHFDRNKIADNFWEQIST